MNRSTAIAALSPLVVNGGLPAMLALLVALAWAGLQHLQGSGGRFLAP